MRKFALRPSVVFLARPVTVWSPGDCARMVRESKALLPSTDIEKPVLPFAIGPWKLRL